MKKLLSILAAVGLTATASTAVVACTTTAKVSNGKATETYKNVKLAKDVKQSDVTKDDFKVTVKNGSDDVTSKVASTVEVSNGKKSDEVTIKVTVDASSLALTKKTTLKVEITTANDASSKKFDKKFDEKFDMKMPKQDGNKTPDTPVTGDYKSLAITSTSTDLWGANSEGGDDAATSVKTVSTITGLFEHADANSDAGKIAAYVKTTLGISAWRNGKAPVLASTYFTEANKPTVADGTTLKHADFDKLDKNMMSSADFNTAAKKGGTFYVMLNDFTGATDTSKNATWSAKVVTIKVTFTKAA